MIELKTAKEIEEMKPAGRFVGEILKELKAMTKVGTNLLEIDEYVHKKIVDRTIREYLPFLATENIMMEAVKRGGDRQALHEVIRQCSMEATARMKNGEEPELLSALAERPELGLSRDELAGILDASLYIGRCPEQVERFLKKIEPLLDGADISESEITL